MARKVLIAVDGSEVATEALQCALRTVGTDARFVVAEVIDPVDRVSALGAAAFDPELIRDALDDLRDDAEQHVAEARERIVAAGAQDVDTRVLEGRAGDALVDYARRGEFDLVVLGTHGRSGLARTLMGSVAEYVVRNLHGTPVLLFHPGEGDTD